MKKSFKYYAVAWALLLIVFNLIAILIPAWPTLDKATPSFWIGYAFINLSMVGHLVCAWTALDEENAKKVFYNISLFKVSCTALMITFIVGLLCMIISPLPYWVGAIVCPLVLLGNFISIAKAKVAVDAVTAIDEKIEQATAFVYEMRAESEALLARATGEMQAVCKKVRDAFKFSDPVSNAALVVVEANITAHFANLKQAVLAGDLAAAQSEREEILALLAERNAKCKALK